MKLIAITIFSLNLIGCAATSEQPITAYRDSMQRINNIYARQVEIESLTGNPPSTYYK